MALEIKHAWTRGPLPTSQYDVVRIADGVVVGMAQLRHRPGHGRDVPAHFASHVYYQIEPAERGQGFATMTLTLIRGEAARLGLDEVVVVCDAANIGSRQAIERNGGVLLAQHVSGAVEFLKFAVPPIVDR